MSKHPLGMCTRLLSSLFATTLLCGASLLPLSGCGGTANENSHSGDELIGEAGMSFEEFKASAIRDGQGTYIVDWDIPLQSEEELRAYYERYVRSGALIINDYQIQVGQIITWEDAKWDDTEKVNLTYCVNSTDFGNNYSAVKAAMAAAAASWEQAAAVDFTHLSAQDSNCNSSNSSVVFDVRADVALPVLAEAFLPTRLNKQDRTKRRILINPTKAFNLLPNETLAGYLRHELGHALGFMHESHRPEASPVGDCATNAHWKELTPFDAVSIMHVPKSPTGQPCVAHFEQLSALDKLGVALVYGVRFTSASHWTVTDYGDAQDWQTDASHWQTIQFPDLNGDGKHDVCGRANDGLYCALSNGPSFGVATLWTNPDYGNAQGWKASPSYWQTIQFPDLNGDGKQDVCGRRSSGLYCALSTGAGFTAPSYWSFSYTDAVSWNTHPSYWQTIRFPDLNGDGKHDVCGRATGGLWCALSTGTAFGAAKYWTSPHYGDGQNWKSDPSYWQTIQYPDLNGDGKQDVCGRAVAGLYCALSTGNAFGMPTHWTTQDFSDAMGWKADPSLWQTIQYPDLNGDGKQDVCGRKSTGLWCALSLGNAFSMPNLWTSSFSNVSAWNTQASRWQTIRFPDLNGDGKQDVCGRSSTGLVCAVSSGAKFGQTVPATPAYADAQSWNSDPSYWQTIQYADLNGDGRQDVCGRAIAGLYCAPMSP